MSTLEYLQFLLKYYAEAEYRIVKYLRIKNSGLELLTLELSNILVLF